MAELPTLARPYARAAFEYGLEDNTVQGWSDFLELAAAVCNQERVRQLIANPSLTASHKAESFLGVLGEECGHAMRNFVHLLASYHRLELLPAIQSAFRVMKANHEKSIDLEVTSAYEISEEQAARLAKAMSAKLKRTIKIQTTIDSNLIGGAQVRAGDLVIDGSVRGKLKRLAEAVES